MDDNMNPTADDTLVDGVSTAPASEGQMPTEETTPTTEGGSMPEAEASTGEETPVTE